MHINQPRHHDAKHDNQQEVCMQSLKFSKAQREPPPRVFGDDDKLLQLHNNQQDFIKNNNNNNAVKHVSKEKEEDLHCAAQQIVKRKQILLVWIDYELICCFTEMTTNRTVATKTRSRHVSAGMSRSCGGVPSPVTAFPVLWRLS